MTTTTDFHLHFRLCSFPFQIIGSNSLGSATYGLVLFLSKIWMSKQMAVSLLCDKLVTKTLAGCCHIWPPDFVERQRSGSEASGMFHQSETVNLVRYNRALLDLKISWPKCLNFLSLLPKAVKRQAAELVTYLEGHLGKVISLGFPSPTELRLTSWKYRFWAIGKSKCTTNRTWAISMAHPYAVVATMMCHIAQQRFYGFFVCLLCPLLRVLAQTRQSNGSNQLAIFCFLSRAA